jgi:hypothetical protein
MDLALGISLLALLCSIWAAAEMIRAKRQDKPSADDGENVFSSKEAEKAANKKAGAKKQGLEETMRSIDDFRKK